MCFSRHVRSPIGSSTGEKEAALIRYSFSSDLRMLPDILHGDINTNATDQDGYTALVAASERGHTDVVNFLLPQGAHINARNKAGNTSTALAAIDCYEAVIRLLLNAEDVDTIVLYGVLCAVVCERHWQVADLLHDRCSLFKPVGHRLYSLGRLRARVLAHQSMRQRPQSPRPR